MDPYHCHRNDGLNYDSEPKQVVRSPEFVVRVAASTRKPMVHGTTHKFGNRHPELVIGQK